MRRRNYMFPAKVKILVSENNIVDGIPGDPEGCAIWRAVMEGEGFKIQPSRCRVMGGRLSVRIGNERAYYSFSRNGAGFQAAYDQPRGEVDAGVVVINRIGEPMRVREATAPTRQERADQPASGHRLIAKAKNVKGKGGGRTFTTANK